MNNNIYVAKSYLPPLLEFISYLEEIWENGILTNNGPMHQKYKTSSKINLPNVNEIVSKILCLPIYPDLSNEDVDKIVRIIKEQA